MELPNNLPLELSNGENKPQNGQGQTPQNTDIPMGRPRLAVSKEIFEALCAQQHTLGEIAAVMGVSEDTIERRCVEWYEMTFAESFRIFRKLGFSSLRRTLWKMKDTEPTIAKYMASHYLGIQEKVSLNVTVDFRLIIENLHRIPTPLLERMRKGEDVGDELEAILKDVKN